MDSMVINIMLKTFSTVINRVGEAVERGRVCQKLMKPCFLWVVRSWTVMYIRRMLQGASLHS